MKRLKYLLISCEPNTSAYSPIYEGKLLIPPGTPGNLGNDTEIQYDPTYWATLCGENVAFTFERPHKLSLDRPTVTVAIPASLLGEDAAALTPGSPLACAAADYCLRAFAPFLESLNDVLANHSRPDRENGRYYINRPGGEVLARNTAYFAPCPQKGYVNGPGASVYLLSDGIERPPRLCLCLKLEVQLPARKLRRTIQMLCRDLPDAAESYLTRFDPTALSRTLSLSQTQSAIRAALPAHNLCAFIANGSLLPRGEDGGPLAGAIPFTSPSGSEITLCGVRGMGIQRGVTVITGGGYSGKSTFLDAISAGIYDHVSGDGRELCLTDASAVSIAAEDGRAINRVNISPFIRWIPGRDPSDFSTAHASGSTSQAANIIEAVAGGAHLLLIDEDRSATNFMIRDRMMKALVARDPITPFTDRVKELSARGVSTILVIGGSGEYLSVADRIYRMDEFIPSDVTAEAKQISQAQGEPAPLSPPAAVWTLSHRISAEHFSPYPAGETREKMQIAELGFLCIGDEQVDIRGLANLACPEQLTAIAFILRRMMLVAQGTGTALDPVQLLDRVWEEITREGLDCVSSNLFPATSCPRSLALPRRTDVLAVISRMRRLTWG